MSDTFTGFTVNPEEKGKNLLLARFYIKNVENAHKSAEAGRPIFDEVEYVEILIPGDRLTVVDRRVKAEDKQEYAASYERFKEGLTPASDGTPLEEWTGISRSLAEELKFFHVRTVETLAQMDDAALKRACPMGGFELRAKAQRYLDKAAGIAVEEKLAAERDTAHATIEAMKDQLATLSAEVERLQRQRPEAA